MDTLMKADIFFFITTGAVVLITICVVVTLFYVARFLSTCNRIAKAVETKAHELGAEVEDVVADVRESFLFRLMFPRRKKTRNKR